MSSLLKMSALLGWLMSGSLTTAASEESLAAPEVNMVIVVGAPGASEYGDQFIAWAGQWADIGKQAGAHVTQIGLEPASEDDDPDVERLQEAIASLQGTEAKTSRSHWLIFIGHGTFQANVAKLNLRGPDVDAEQLAKWLAPLQRPVVFVNVAAASGPFVNALSGPNRIVVAATKSGTEQNFARFGAYLPRALADPSSDLDHDEEISLLEAVLKASSETGEFYAAEGRIRTEHAILDDNGDRLGTPAEMLDWVIRGTPAETLAPAKTGSAQSKMDGDMAAKTILVPAVDAPRLSEEDLVQRARLEAELLALRARQASLSEDEYFAQVEMRMLQLAAIYRAADNREKSPASSP